MAVTTDLAALLGQQLASGAGSARASFAGKDQAFSYVGTRVNALAGVVQSGVSHNSNFTAVKIETADDVAAWTSGDKPITSTVTAEPISMSIYPGVCVVKTREVLDTAGLGAAISNALYSQALAALDADIVTDLKAVADGVAKAATLATIAEAQAAILGRGFSPDVVAVSAALYGTLASTSGIITAGMDPTQAIQTILGSRVVVSPSLGAAEAIVLDSQAVMVVEHDSSPVALLDVHARQNTVDVVIEVVGGHVIVNEAGVCPVAAGA